MGKRFRRHFLTCLLGAMTLACVAIGCGDDAGAKGDAAAGSGEKRVLGAKETRALLRQLPYSYKFRRVSVPDGAEGAVAGQAVGPHQTVFNFGIALGHGHRGVPVPRSGTLDIYGYPQGGFIFTGDSLVRGANGHLEPNPRLQTAAQWKEAGHMEVLITDKLCRAATGQPCPI